MTGVHFHARLLAGDSIAALTREMKRLEVDRGGISLMAPKGVVRAILVEDVPTRAANIIKQEILARGGDLATPWSAADFAAERVDVIVIGNLVTLRSLVAKLYRQTVYHLPEFADALQGVLMRTVPGYLPVARKPARQGQVAEETLDDLHGGRIPVGAGGRSPGLPQLEPPRRWPQYRWAFGETVYTVAVLPDSAGEAAGEAAAAGAAGALIAELPRPNLELLQRLHREQPQMLLAAPVADPRQAEAVLAAGADILRASLATAPDLAPTVEAAGAMLWVELGGPGGEPGEPGGGPGDSGPQEGGSDPLVGLGRKAWHAVLSLAGRGLGPGRLVLDVGPDPALSGQAARRVTRRLRELTSYGVPLAFSPPPAPAPAMAATMTRAALGGVAFFRLAAHRVPSLAPALDEIAHLLVQDRAGE